MEIGVIGLGKMGSAIASRLLDAGHELTVYNRTPEKANSLLEMGAMLAHDPSGAATGDIVITMLADDRAIEEIFFGTDGEAEGFFGHQADHTVHVSMGTIGFHLTEKIALASASKNLAFISAPVLGRPEVAERGELIVMAAGDKAYIEKCAPVFQAISKYVHVLGDRPEQASVAKLTANFMISSMIETYAEAFAMVRKNGIDHHTFLKMMASEFFKSGVHEKYGKIIADEDFDSGEFSINMQEKDTRLLIAAAIDARVPMPFATVIENTFLSAIGRGMGDLDPCAISRLAADNAGLSRS